MCIHVYICVRARVRARVCVCNFFVSFLFAVQVVEVESGKRSRRDNTVIMSPGSLQDICLDAIVTNVRVIRQTWRACGVCVGHGVCVARCIRVCAACAAAHTSTH